MRKCEKSFRRPLWKIFFKRILKMRKKSRFSHLVNALGQRGDVSGPGAFEPTRAPGCTWVFAAGLGTGYWGRLRSSVGTLICRGGAGEGARRGGGSFSTPPATGEEQKFFLTQSSWHATHQEYPQWLDDATPPYSPVTKH